MDARNAQIFHAPEYFWEYELSLQSIRPNNPLSELILIHYTLIFLYSYPLFFLENIFDEFVQMLTFFLQKKVLLLSIVIVCFDFILHTLNKEEEDTQHHVFNFIKFIDKELSDKINLLKSFDVDLFIL